MLTDLTSVSLGYEMAKRVDVVRGAAESTRVVDHQANGSFGQEVEPTRSVDSAKMAGAYAVLRSRQDELNEVAAVVHDINSVTDKAEQLLGDMESTLGTLVKIYPPYPLDDPERVSMLNSFAGLRKQIDALTFPTPEELVAIGRLPELAGEASENGQLATSTGLNTEVGYGEVKIPLFDIPDLDSKSASDAEVAKTFEKVVAAKDAVQELQSRIWKDVEAFLGKAVNQEVQAVAENARHRLAQVTGLGIGVYSGPFSRATETV